MKSRLTVLLVLCFAATALQAQVPEKMSYQAVIRNSGDELVTNTQIGMRISILSGSATGAAVYTETQTPTTNANGLVSIEFGGGAGFAAIDWSNGVYFLKTETDINGGTDYTITGTSQLLTVPYALYAKTAGSVSSENQPPTCSITYPADNARVGVGDNIQIAANDTDGNVAEVQLFIDNVFYSSKIAPPYNFTIKENITLGAHTIIAIAKDDKGAVTKSAEVNITVVTLAVGMSYQGGIIAYIDGTGQHGLIAAPSDQSTGILWNNGSTYKITDTTSTGIGTGKSNTTAIVAVQGVGSYAAKLCDDLVLNGYSDWFLPSLEELRLLYQNRSLIGGFANGSYWSSSEDPNYNAWCINFSYGIQSRENKISTYRVRAVRYF